jgi:hypothetical protein
MTDEPKTPAGKESQRVELVQPAEEGEIIRAGDERGLQVVPMNVVPESERPTGGGDIPPPVSAEPSAERPSGAAPAESPPSSE